MCASSFSTQELIVLSKILFLLFLSGILVHALVVDFDTLLNFIASHMPHSTATPVYELRPTTRNDPSPPSSKNQPDLEKCGRDTAIIPLPGPSPHRPQPQN